MGQCGDAHHEIHQSVSFSLWVLSDITHSVTFGALGRQSSSVTPLISRHSGSSFLHGSPEIAEECQNKKCAAPLNGEEQEHQYQSQFTTRNSVIAKKC